MTMVPLTAVCELTKELFDRAAKVCSPGEMLITRGDVITLRFH